MHRGTFLAALAVVLTGGRTSRADTALVHVTPRNLQAWRFSVTVREARGGRVEFIVSRNIQGIDGPGRQAYLSHPATTGNGLGTPSKVEEKDGILTFRFLVPVERVPGTLFTLWGQGARGEGITFRLNLADFRKPA